MTVANPDQSRRTRHVAMPEWITRKDQEGGSWVVHEGRPERGDAWTNMVKREMRVPTGDDPISRVVRAHEMVHTKVSPAITHLDGRYGVTNESLEVAEEFRVNTLVGLAGFDTDALADGSEQRAGEIAAMNRAWNEAVRFLCAVADTKAAKSFLYGVKKHDEEMAGGLNEVHKKLKKAMRGYVKTYGHKRIASTTPTDRWGKDTIHPEGFVFAVRLARIVDQHLIVPDEVDGDDIVEGDGENEIMDANEVKTRGKGKASDGWAPLLELVLPKPRTANGSLGRRRRPSNIGTNPRRLSRMLTDSERRVFDHKVRGNGGIVIIDQSSSMRLTEAQLWQVVNASPGCLVIGYSHKAGSTNVPNIWVLADRGKVVDKLPEKTAGNGVDGPALRFAIKRRRNNEPIIWVCDGQVTDRNDRAGLPELINECATLVVRHKIHQVATVDEAVVSLSKVARGERLPVKAVGHISQSAVWRRQVAV